MPGKSFSCEINFEPATSNIDIRSDFYREQKFNGKSTNAWRWQEKKEKRRTQEEKEEEVTYVTLVAVVRRHKEKKKRRVANRLTPTGR